MVIMPMQTPPQNAATGMYPSKYLTMDSSLKPLILTCSSFNFLATSLELSPEIWIQNLAKNPHVNTTNET